MADKGYIEKQAAIELLRDNINLPIDSGTARAYWTRVVEIKDALIGHISKIPAADVVEVRHGEWFLLDECSNEGVYCSVCTKKVYRTEYANQKLKSNYCPNCGAKMDGERKEATP